MNRYYVEWSINRRGGGEVWADTEEAARTMVEDFTEEDFSDTEIRSDYDFTITEEK